MNSDQKFRKYSSFMLVILMILGLGLIYFAPKVNLGTKPVANSKEVSQSPTVEDLEKQGIKAEFVEILGASTGSGGQSGPGGCTGGRKCDSNVNLAPIPMCSVNDAGGSMLGGDANEGKSFVSVRLNAKVEPFEITTPQVLLQGSKYVDDSRKIISYDYPVYRDSQNIILADEARRVCAPGVDCEMFDQIAGRKDFPFKVQSYVEVKNADEGGNNGKGNTVIYSVPSLRSACPDIQMAKANPRKASGFSGELDVRRQIPVDPKDKTSPTNNGGIHSVSRSFAAVQCLRKPPDGETLDEAETFKMCITDVKPTDFVVAAVYEIEQWLDCLLGDADCSESKTFAIRMDPLYGGQMKCAKPDCEIRYFEYEYLKNIAPGDAGSQIPAEIDKNKVNTFQPVTDAYYIETPCKIRINKWGVHDLPCIWDISPYKKQFEIQKAAYMPLDPTMPQSFDEYWNGGVMPELRKRSNSCI